MNFKKEKFLASILLKVKTGLDLWTALPILSDLIFAISKIKLSGIFFTLRKYYRVEAKNS